MTRCRRGEASCARAISSRLSLSGLMVPALVLPEPLQTPGRSVHAQRPHQKAARCHVDPYQARCRRRYTSEMSFFCGYLRQFHSSTDCPRDISQSRAPRSVASRRQPLPTSHHRQARTSSQNVGGQIGRAVDRAMPLPPLDLGCRCVVSGDAQGTRDVFHLDFSCEIFDGFRVGV